MAIPPLPKDISLYLPKFNVLSLPLPSEAVSEIVTGHSTVESAQSAASTKAKFFTIPNKRFFEVPTNKSLGAPTNVPSLLVWKEVLAS